MLIEYLAVWGEALLKGCLNSDLHDRQIDDRQKRKRELGEFDRTAMAVWVSQKKNVWMSYIAMTNSTKVDKLSSRPSSNIRIKGRKDETLLTGCAGDMISISYLYINAF